MTKFPEGNAIVYCEGAFNTPNGKTAHGLVRFTERYRVVSVIDSTWAGRDAGEVLDGVANGIPIYESIHAATQAAWKHDVIIHYFVVGLAPDGGRLDKADREVIKKAINMGFDIDCGLHDFLSADRELAQLARENEAKLRDIRKTPPREQLHFFSGKIEDVDSLKIAVLGTDSAIGKRTTAWLIVHGLRAAGKRAELVGTGQTAWMQGARYSLIMDSLINDFVSGEIEHAVWSAWREDRPHAIVIEGQGSLMNPAYPGGFEILAAGRPDVIVLQHAPARTEYDGFPGYPIHPLPTQIQAIELLSGKPVVAVTVNHEDLDDGDIEAACRAITAETGLPAYDVLKFGAGPLVELLAPLIRAS